MRRRRLFDNQVRHRERSAAIQCPTLDILDRHGASRLAKTTERDVAVVTPEAGPVLIYKITPRDAWREAETAALYIGAPVDVADGFIHFSTAEQARETAARHFAGQSGLLLIAVEAEALGPALRWEASRGGALFPHLYGPLPLAAVRAVVTLPLGDDGRHLFPEGVA